MKKALFVFALIALASAAFADLSITDWAVNAYGGGYPDYGDILSDVSPAGFVFANDPQQWPNNLVPKPFFRSITVSGWVYDEDEGFNITIEGFEGADKKVDGFDGDSIQVQLGRGVLITAIYQTTWNGDGTYFFDKDNLTYSYRTEGDILNVFVRLLIDDHEYQFADNATGSVQFALGKPAPQPETEVPEPGVCAYGALGLVSLLGMKRRIRK